MATLLSKYFMRFKWALPVLALAFIALSTPLFSATVQAQDGCVEVGIDVGQGAGNQICPDGSKPGAEGNVIFIYMKYIINFLAVGVGVAVAVSIAIAGFQYITSEGNPQKLSGAKNRLFHAVVALILFILMYALLQFLIPGDLL